MMGKPKTYCGYDVGGMNRILDVLCRLEDGILMTDEEQDAFDIAIQCVSDMVNRLNGIPVEWEDDPDE